MEDELKLQRSPVCRYPLPVHDVSLKAGTDIAEGPGAGLARHEDGLCDIVQHLDRPVQWPSLGDGHLQQELRVGTGLGGALDLAGVELAALLGLEDPGESEVEEGGREGPVDGGEEGGVEEVLADTLHVTVHQGRC